jgi:hypothetical protein
MLLLGVIGLPLIGPALASTPSDSDLPACCRRDGKHHCGMAEKPRTQEGPTWQSARCPSFPSVKALPAPDLAAVAPPDTRIAAPAPAHRTARPQTAPARRASFDLDRQKRGPPYLS